MRLIACLLGTCFALAGCDSQPAEPPQGKAPVAATAAAKLPPGVGRLDRSFAGRPAPTAAFEDPDGELTSLVQFRGTPVLVNLWATGCGPCVAEMPMLDALAGEAKGYEVLTISQDVDGRGKVDAFFAKHGYKHLEEYLDPELSMMTEMQVDTLPTTILYDKDGREVWRMTGREEWNGPRAKALIAESL